MTRQLSLEALKLLSQIISDIDEHREIFQKTSCLNQSEAKVVSTLLWLTPFIAAKNPNLANRLKNQIIPLFEYLGIAKWNRDPLTHLGFRVGLKHIGEISLAPDKNVQTVDEALVYAESATTQT